MDSSVMEQSLQKALVQQVFFLQFQQYQLLNYLNLIYLCGPVIFVVLCDGGSSLVFFPVARQSSYSITKEMYSPVIGVSLENAFVQQFLQFSIFSVNTFFQSIIVQYSSICICISVNVRGEQQWCVPLCPKMTVCELYRGKQVGASKNY